MSTTTTTTVLTAEAAQAADAAAHAKNAALQLQVDDLTARVTALEGGAKPPVGPTPAADGFKVTAPGTAFYDDALNQWQLVALAGQGNTVQWMPKGTAAWVAAGYSANVAAIEKWKTTAYQTNGTGWWSWNGTTWVAAPGDPSVPVVPPVTPPANANVVCNFGNPTAKLVSPFVWGFCGDAMIVKQYPYTPDFTALLDPTFQASLAKLKPASLRWNTQQSGPLFAHVFRNGAANPDWAYLDTWTNNHAGFFNDATGRLIIGIGPMSGDTSISAATYASWVAPLLGYFKTHGNIVPWIEVGNECGGAMANGTYISYFNAIADAAHAVSPAIRVGGPMAAYWDCGGLGGALIAACAAKIGFVCTHMYGGQPGEPQLANPPAMWARALQQEVTAMRSTMRAAGIADSVPVMLGEFNMVLDDSGGKNQNPGWENSVFTALALYTRWANDPSFTMGNVWDAGGFSAASDYATIASNTSGNNNAVISPQGQFLGRAGQVMGGVEAPFSTTLGGLYGIASLNGKAFAVQLINTGAAASVVLNMGGRAAAGNVARWEIGAANPVNGIASTIADLTKPVPVPANQVVILNGTLV